MPNRPIAPHSTTTVTSAMPPRRRARARRSRDAGTGSGAVGGSSLTARCLTYPRARVAETPPLRRRALALAHQLAERVAPPVDQRRRHPGHEIARRLVGRARMRMGRRRLLGLLELL